MMQRLRVAFGDTVEAYIIQRKRIWWIVCSVCISTLWMQLNRVVHGQFNFHSRGVSERFALMAFGNYERYRRESAESYIQGCKASVYGSASRYSTPALRLPEHHILW